MYKYEELLQEAHEEGVDVVCRPLKGRLKGLYYDQVIAINNNMTTTAEKVCILAEELGHYHTTTGDILDQSKIQNRKQERLAKAWSYARLVPLDKLAEAHKAGARTRDALAEYLSITEQFLMAALGYYIEKHGVELCNLINKWRCPT